VVRQKQELLMSVNEIRVKRDGFFVMDFRFVQLAPDLQGICEIAMRLRMVWFIMQSLLVRGNCFCQFPLFVENSAEIDVCVGII